MQISGSWNQLHHRSSECRILWDKFIEDKSFSLKDVPKNTEKSIAPDESVSPEAEGNNAEEETSEVLGPPSKHIKKQHDFGDDFITYNAEEDSQTF